MQRNVHEVSGLRFALLASLTLVLAPAPHLAGAGHPTGYNFHSWIVAGGPGDDQANAVAVDSQGHVHVAGSFEGIANFGPTRVVSAGMTDAFLARYDNRGILLWIRTFSSTGSATATAVAADPDGCSLVAGHFQGNLQLAGTILTNRGSFDGFVSKLDPQGAVLWTVQTGGPVDDRVNALAVDGTGHTAIAGHFMSTVAFGATNLTSTASHPDIFLARISPDGEVLWAAQGGGPLSDDALGLAVDALGNSVVVGTVSGTNTFGSLTLTNPAQPKIVVAACDRYGRFLWASSGGSDRADTANAVALGPDGSATVTGTFGGPATLEGLALTHDATRYTFTARYTAAGALEWLVAHPGQESRAIATSNSGQVTVAGSFTGTRALGSHLLASAGAFDWFLLEHDPHGNIQWARAAGGPAMDYVHGLAPGGGSDLWLAGRATTNAAFDHLVLTNAQRFDLVVARLSPAPLIREPPVPVVARVGTAVTLQVGAVGAEPLEYQWYRNHTVVLPEARESSFVLDPARLEDSGLYTVTVTNPFGSVTNDPVAVTLFGLPTPEVRINGETGTHFFFVDVPSVRVSIDSSEPGFDLYYTLDGSQPSLGSTPYTAPFELRGSARVRAIAYGADLSSAEAEATTVALSLSPPIITVDGQSDAHLTFTNAGSVRVTLQAGLEDAAIVYTLDDSDPATHSIPYTRPFDLTHTAIIRAMAYTPELGSATAGPVKVEFLRTHPLSVSPSADGTVTLKPPGGDYLEGSIVQLEAHAAPGWEFLHWTGDFDAREPVATLLMDTAKTVGAVFGTRLELVTDGPGRVLLAPAGILFERGTTLTATAVPEPGYFFARWSGAVSGTDDRVVGTVNQANPVWVASFSPLPPNTFTLTVTAQGRGSVEREPRAPYYDSGATVVLTALPDPGEHFLLWTGDVITPANPVMVALTAHRRVDAYFTGAGFLRLEALPVTDGAHWRLRVRSDPGSHLLLQVSTNLAALPAWIDHLTFTNLTGADLITTPALPGPGPVLYRATAPGPNRPQP